MATTDIYSVAGGLYPTRAALRFLGGNVDDGVQVDSLIQAIVAGNHTMGTITAWIMCPDDTGTYTIFGAGDANAAEYCQILNITGKIEYYIYDGGAARVDVITTNKVIKPHKWTHVAVVQDGKLPIIYIDGLEVATTKTTSTELSQWFDDTDGIDGAHIGATDSLGGDAALTNEFAGYISDFRIWSGTTSTAALTAAQIWQEYKGDYSNTTSLLAHYTMNRTVVNQANPATYDGTIVGSLIYTDANEFTSKLSFECGVPVTGDNVSISCDNGIGYGIVIQAA